MFQGIINKQRFLELRHNTTTTKMGNRTKQVHDLKKTALTSKVSADEPKERKKRRRKRGSKSLSEIKAAQRATKHMLRTDPTKRLIRECVQNCNLELQISAKAFEAMRVALEAYGVDIMKQATKCTVLRKSQTLVPEDMQTALSIASHQDINS